MTSNKTRARLALAGLTALLLAGLAFGGGDVPTQFTNRDSIRNTRHNMIQSTMQNGQGGQMDPYRNDYGDVCVYCHTPHGTAAGAPLWNRVLPDGGSFNSYTTLNSTTLSQAVSPPGVNSLICLSCHDGATAIDAVMNMPGKPNYSGTPDDAFLDTWGGPADTHMTMTQCMTCHNPAGSGPGITYPTATDFSAFLIGKDLRNDHPVGIAFPAAHPDFNVTTGTYSNTKFFDRNGNNRPDPNEIRVYDTGDGHEVECSSCHDPHGVPSGGAGSQFIATFMRVANSENSGLCLTCHVK